MKAIFADLQDLIVTIYLVHVITLTINAALAKHKSKYLRMNLLLNIVIL